MLMPTCGNRCPRVSNPHPESNVSDVHHSASRTFTTNQPSETGARPEPLSSRGASGTARPYLSARPIGVDARGDIVGLEADAPVCRVAERLRPRMAAAAEDDRV